MIPKMIIRFWKSVSKLYHRGVVWEFLNYWRVSCPTWLLKVWILIFRIGWNMEWMELGSLESPSPKPHFRPWKAIFDHKKSTFDHFEPFSNHQVSSVCHFRLWSSDSQWFKLIQTESKSRVRKPEFPKIKTNKIFHAFNLPFHQFF